MGTLFPRSGLAAPRHGGLPVGSLALVIALWATQVSGCELALLLAIDISGSVDDGEYRLQVDGTADALSDPAVADALVQGNVALAVVQWSAVGMQKVVQPWTRMDSRADVAAFADVARATGRAFGKADTAVADAIAYSVAQFGNAPVCRRHVIDISGDGQQNAGSALPDARQRAIDAGITINAIAIEGLGLSITEFYRYWVITDTGFVMTSRGHSDYPAAIRAKLLREVAVPMG